MSLKSFFPTVSFGLKSRDAESGSKRFDFDCLPGMPSELTAEVERMMAAFGTPGQRPHLSGGPQIRETEEGIEIEGQFPGLDEKDLEVILSGAALTIRGQHSVEQTNDAPNRHFAGRSITRFSQTVNLPFEPDPDSVRTEFKDGVLKIFIRKDGSMPFKTARIPVQRA